MSRPTVLVQAWLPDGRFEQLAGHFPEFEFLDGRAASGLEANLPRATIVYGLPPVARLGEARQLRWIQLAFAGVPQDLCPAAQRRGLTVTNMAGLYGPTIAEHALALMTLTARNLHLALRQQLEKSWDRSVGSSMTDLHGRTAAILGLGNIGRHIARLARAFGMRVVGCRRSDAFTSDVDEVYPRERLRDMLAEADHLVVALPLTAQTEGLIGPAEFAAMRPGIVYTNVSRGGVAQEPALLDALRRGHVAAAGLDVFAVEPLPAEHPFWTMPQVVISPHYAGETVNRSDQPARRFARNLVAWQMGRPLEGMVNLERGY